MLCASDLLLIEDTVWRIFVSQAQHVLGTVHCWKAKPIHVSAASEVGMDASLALHCPSRARYGAVGGQGGCRFAVDRMPWRGCVIRYQVLRSVSMIHAFLGR